ncbi:hypothetical protein HCI99_12970 [Listeria booriae]|uniref:Uncharacterized protein n=1 Tax=Listeria booriae TaxID=1552123 RepID=A0A7X0XEG3_9LIST|nr:hypothetical protein [Listeria booriae]MBC1492730.1 hypothetical protein [Listeria booriae]
MAEFQADKPDLPLDLLQQNRPFSKFLEIDLDQQLYELYYGNSLILMSFTDIDKDSITTNYKEELLNQLKAAYQNVDQLDDDVAIALSTTIKNTNLALNRSDDEYFEQTLKNSDGSYGQLRISTDALKECNYSEGMKSFALFNRLSKPIELTESNINNLQFENVKEYENTIKSLVKEKEDVYDVKNPRVEKTPNSKLIDAVMNNQNTADPGMYEEFVDKMYGFETKEIDYEDTLHSIYDDYNSKLNPLMERSKKLEENEYLRIITPSEEIELAQLNGQIQVIRNEYDPKISKLNSMMKDVFAEKTEYQRQYDSQSKNSINNDTGHSISTENKKDIKANFSEVSILKMKLNDKGHGVATVQYGEITLNNIRIVDSNGIPNVYPPSVKGKDDKYYPVFELNDKPGYDGPKKMMEGALTRGFYELKHGVKPEITNEKIFNLDLEKMQTRAFTNATFENGNKSMNVAYGAVQVKNCVVGKAKDTGNTYVQTPSYKTQYKGADGKDIYRKHVSGSKPFTEKVIQAANQEQEQKKTVKQEVPAR